MTRRPLLALTGLRAWLALWVVVFHQASPDGYLGPRLPSLPSPVFDVLRTGYVAVGVFFVLSGFVLGYSYSLDHRWTWDEWRRFAGARVARIYPAYLLGLVIVAPLMLREAQITGAWTATLGTGVLHLALLQAWLPGLATAWNSPGWSLSAEAFFYAVFPVLGVWLWRRHGAAPWLWLLALLAPLWAMTTPLGTARATDLSVADPWLAALIAFTPVLRVAEFCIGILLASLFARVHTRWRGAWLSCSALVLELLVLTHAHRVPLVLLSNGLLLPLHACLLLGLALEGGPLAWVLARPTMVFLGQASYAMYILHVPIEKWLNLVAHRAGVPLVGLGVCTAYVALVILSASVVMVMVEDPIVRWWKRRSRLPVFVSAPNGE